MGSGGGRSGTRRRDPPISGRLVLEDQPGAVGVAFPEGFGRAPPTRSGRRWLPLSMAAIRLYLVAEPETDLGLWSEANPSGGFQVSQARLDEAAERLGRALPPADLGLEVFPANPTRVVVGDTFQSGTNAMPLRGEYRAADPDAGRLEQRWSLRVSSAEDAPVRLADGLATGMRIVVPEPDAWSMQVTPVARGTRPDTGATTALFLTGTGGQHPSYPGWYAFLAYAVLMEMRAWYHNEYVATHDGHGPPRIRVLYPSVNPTSSYDEQTETLLLRGATPDFVVTQDASHTSPSPLPDMHFTLSDLCHEFGHCLQFSAARGQPLDRLRSTSHDFYGMSRSSDEERQMGIELVEAYATFLGQSFLRSSVYMEDPRAPGWRRLGRHDLETPGFRDDGTSIANVTVGTSTLLDVCRRGYGDWCTASYLWDLFDAHEEARPGRAERDALALPWGAIHAYYRDYAASRRGEILTICGLHDFVWQAETANRTALEQLLEDNHLADRYRARTSRSALHP